MRPLHLLWALLLLLPAPRAAARRGRGDGPQLPRDRRARRCAGAGYAVTPTNFVRQMDWLRNNGYHFVERRRRAGRAARGGSRCREKAVLVTFDDGYRSVYDHAWPMLKMFRIPAVDHVVGSWLEEKDTVDFDGRSSRGGKLMSWEELREMRESGLVEIGSHSYDLHRGMSAIRRATCSRPARRGSGCRRAARYEDEATYRQRVEADLRATATHPKPHRQCAARDRLAVRALQRRDHANRRAARDAHRAHARRRRQHRADTPLWGLRRILVERGMSLRDLEREITLRNQNLSDNDRPQKVMHVDLDYIYDADPAQQERNLGHLLDRIAALGVNTVYLQAFSDPDGNGSADAVYFPTATCRCARTCSTAWPGRSARARR